MTNKIGVLMARLEENRFFPRALFLVWFSEMP